MDPDEERRLREVEMSMVSAVERLKAHDDKFVAHEARMDRQFEGVNKRIDSVQNLVETIADALSATRTKLLEQDTDRYKQYFIIALAVMGLAVTIALAAQGKLG